MVYFIEAKEAFSRGERGAGVGKSLVSFGSGLGLVASVLNAAGYVVTASAMATEASIATGAALTAGAASFLVAGVVLVVIGFVVVNLLTTAPWQQFIEHTPWGTPEPKAGIETWSGGNFAEWTDTAGGMEKMLQVLTAMLCSYTDRSIPLHVGEHSRQRCRGVNQLRLLTWTGTVLATRVFHPSSEQRAAAMARLDVWRLVQQLRRDSNRSALVGLYQLATSQSLRASSTVKEADLLAAIQAAVESQRILFTKGGGSGTRPSSAGQVNPEMTQTPKSSEGRFEMPVLAAGRRKSRLHGCSEDRECARVSIPRLGGRFRSTAPRQ